MLDVGRAPSDRRKHLSSSCPSTRLRSGISVSSLSRMSARHDFDDSVDAVLSWTAMSQSALHARELMKFWAMEGPQTCTFLFACCLIARLGHHSNSGTIGT